MFKKWEINLLSGKSFKVIIPMGFLSGGSLTDIATLNSDVSLFPSLMQKNK
jgi:hypothetical protein